MVSWQAWLGLGRGWQQQAGPPEASPEVRAGVVQRAARHDRPLQPHGQAHRPRVHARAALSCLQPPTSSGPYSGIDFTKTGLNNIVVGREDGGVEVLDLEEAGQLRTVYRWAGGRRAGRRRQTVQAGVVFCLLQ